MYNSIVYVYKNQKLMQAAIQASDQRPLRSAQSI